MKTEFYVWQVIEEGMLLPPLLHDVPVDSPCETIAHAKILKETMTNAFGSDFTKDWVLCKTIIETVEEDEVIV